MQPHANQCARPGQKSQHLSGGAGNAEGGGSRVWPHGYMANMVLFSTTALPLMWRDLMFFIGFFLRVCYNILTHFLLSVMMRGCHDKDFSLFSFLSGGPVFRTSNNFLLDFFSLLLYNNFCKVYFIRFQAYWVKTMVFIVLALFLFEKERRI